MRDGGPKRTNCVVLRAPAGRIALLLALAALVSFPAAATARPGFFVRPAHEEVTLPGQAGEGWSVFILARHRATVVVEDAPGTEGVTYELPATLRGNRLEVHYGGVIDVSVRFHPRTRRLVPVLPHEHCSGRPPEILSGTFVGKIEFHGELGYAELDESSHKGTLERSVRQVCRRRHPAKAAVYLEAPVEQLVAERRKGDGETFFAAISNFPTLIPHPRWSFEASRSEHEGRVKIVRQVGLELEAGAAFTDEEGAPPSATIEPPTPFSGRAEYRGGPGPITWTGSLGVTFPGLAPTALTGHGFTTHFCVGEGRAARPCEHSPLAEGLL
ncbi:MAG: hypothetical protein J0H06_10285 [Actinobacteria bacterium]|nr:hypothetical protein [Actinomycetota bacterium]